MNEAELRRRQRVLTLSAAGLTPAQIARQEADENKAEPRTPAEVAADLRAALSDRKAIDDDHRSLAVTLELERLDAIQRIMEAVLRSSQGGRCGACGRGGDPELALKSSGTLIRLADRRASLLGLDFKYGAPEAPKAGPMDELRARRDAKLKELGQ